MKIPSFKRIAGVVLVNLAMVLVVLELGLRLILGQTFPPRFFQPHAQLGHFHVPNRQGYQTTSEYRTWVAINTQGLRDDPIPYERPPQEWRMLVMGDSFVEGLQVSLEATFPQQTEALLRECCGTGIQVINAGVSRYGTAHAARFWELEGQRYDPQVAVYVFYPNDVGENAQASLYNLQNGQLIGRDHPIPASQRRRAWLYDHFYLYRTGLGLYQLWTQQTDSRLIRTEWGLILPLYRRDLLPQDQSEWAWTGQLLAHLAASVEAYGVPLVVVYMPERFQSEEEQWRLVDSSTIALRRDGPRDDLLALLPDSALWLDLSDPLRSASQTTSLYYPIDGHLNAAGHRVVAQELAHFLQTEGLISGTID